MTRNLLSRPTIRDSKRYVFFTALETIKGATGNSSERTFAVLRFVPHQVMLYGETLCTYQHPREARPPKTRSEAAKLETWNRGHLKTHGRPFVGTLKARFALKNPRGLVYANAIKQYTVDIC